MCHSNASGTEIIENETAFDLIMGAKLRRAAFWDTKASLAQAYYYIKGFECGRASAKARFDERHYKYIGAYGCSFQEFVENKTNLKKDKLWYQIIEFLAVTPEGAIDIFYSLLEEFFETDQ